MAMSSGKSNSMAAVLLVVALVVGTCACGAQAEFNITLDHCNQRGLVVIRSPNALSNKPNAKAFINYTLAPGGSVDVNAPTILFFRPPFTFTFATKGSQPIMVPERELGTLRELSTALEKIEIGCGGIKYTDCIKLYVTYKLPGFPRGTELLDMFCPVYIKP